MKIRKVLFIFKIVHISVLIELKIMILFMFFSGFMEDKMVLFIFRFCVSGAMEVKEIVLEFFGMHKNGKIVNIGIKGFTT